MDCDLYFMIFSVSELNKINFDEVLQTSIDTVRKSIDETKTFKPVPNDSTTTYQNNDDKSFSYIQD